MVLGDTAHYLGADVKPGENAIGRIGVPDSTRLEPPVGGPVPNKTFAIKPTNQVDVRDSFQGPSWPQDGEVPGPDYFLG
jgi:hypothetical protein